MYCFFLLAGTFGRRASDGGANLHIHFPTSSCQTSDNGYSRQNSREYVMMNDGNGNSQQNPKTEMNMESSEDSNDEIQRYMHGRGCSKRHTVACTDDLSGNGQCMEPPLAHSPIPSTSAMSPNGSSGGRTRRTGLLTVMERPPGKKKLQFICNTFSFVIIVCV